MSDTNFTFVKIQSTHTPTISKFVDKKGKKIKIIKRRR